MEILIRLMAVLSGGLFLGGVTAVAVPPSVTPTPVVETTPVVHPPQKPANSVWRDSAPQGVPRLPDAECPGWLGLATSVGWPLAALPTLDEIMYRESRCMPESFNGKDPNGGSAGLMQINYYWCKPSRWYAEGYLQYNGVLNTCKDLFDPRVNLLAALVIYKYSVETSGNGWRPWRT